MVQHKAAVGQNMSLYSYIQNTGFQVVRLKSDNSHPGVIHISGTKSRERERERERDSSDINTSMQRISAL